MAFEPLQTDEKLTGPRVKTRSMDDQMLFGCTGFVLTSVSTYIASVWPWFVFAESERLAAVLLCLGLGAVPAFGFGVWSVRRFGLPGLCGVLGGAMTTGVFLFLRLQQAQLSGLAEQHRMPDYPSALVWLVPLVWILLALLVSLAVLPKGELGEDPPASRP